VTLNLDISTPIRTPARYRELVMAIYGAPASTQESNWAEWKSQVDVGEKRWQAELSRQVLGMANRDPEVAAKWAGGCAFVVVGVSPGVLIGTVVHDTAKIEAWLTPYVGRTPNAPEWTPAYVEVDGKPVLILTVEPPQFGHPAWPCRKSYSPDRRTGEDTRPGVRDGAVYSRHKASTEEANSADIEMLSRRAAGSRRRIAGISLLLAPNCRAVSLDPNEDAITAWAGREREAMKPPPPPETPKVPANEMAESSLLATAKLVAELSEQMNKGLFFGRDARTPEEYRAEVEAYIANATKVLPSYIIRRAYERKLGRIALSVRNNTDDPIHKLRVELVIEPKGVMAFSQDVDVPDVALPKRPIMLGNATRSVFDGLGGIQLANYDRYLPSGARLIGRGVRIDNSNSARLTFEAIDLYPQETAELDEFYLLTSIDHTGATLIAQWNARAGDVSGVIRGTLEIEVDPKMPAIEELLAKDEKPAADHDDEAGEGS
jgi:hypothetical protein